MHCEYICPDEEYNNKFPVSKQETQTSKFSTPHKPQSPYKTPLRTRPASQDLSETYLKSLRVHSTSKKILKGVFEQEWSVNSYSKNKRLQILKRNISASKSEVSEDRIPSPDKKLVKKFENYRLESSPFEEYLEKFKAHLENVKKFEFNGIEYLEPDLQIVKLLEYVSSPCRDLKYGAIFSVFLIICQNPAENLTDMVLETILQQLETWQDEDDEYIEALLFVVGFIGENRNTVEKIPKILEILVHDETSETEKIHQAAFSCLNNLGIEGIKHLVDLALNGSVYLKLWILQRLLLTELIQISVIIPALIQDFLHCSVSIRTAALAALNRMLFVVGQTSYLDCFVGALENFEEKTLIACIIRYFGLPGEKILHNLCKKSEKSEVKVACLKALSLKFSDFSHQIHLIISENSVESDQNLMPGTFWKYKGPKNSIFEEKTFNSSLEVNSRDFLAILQRWIKTRTVDNKESVFPKIPRVGKSMEDSQIFEFCEKSRIRNNALAVCVCTADKNKDVRKVAVSLLNRIEIPDDMKVTRYIKNCLQDPDSQVRASAASVSSTLCTGSKKVLELLLKLLKDNYPQVRNTACTALKMVGRQSSKKVIPILTKLLKDGALSRQVVADSLVGLGTEGQLQIIEILHKEPLGNLSLRTCIIKALGTADVNSNNIDFVIETLFKITQEGTPGIRKVALLSLCDINQQAKDKLLYLKPGTLLPLFIKYLKDPCKEVRKVCVSAIVDFGAQGELVLLEAFTKDSNFIIRAQAAKGLGLLGNRFFKTLILGLHDSHFYVRKNTDKTLRKCFSVDGILQEFIHKPKQIQTLKCAIKDVLSLPYKFSEQCKKLLRDVLEEFSLAERLDY